jgi:hypothetical protein
MATPMSLKILATVLLIGETKERLTQSRIKVAVDHVGPSLLLLQLRSAMLLGLVNLLRDLNSKLLTVLIHTTTAAQVECMIEHGVIYKLWVD